MSYQYVTKQTHVEVHVDEPETYLGVWKSAGGFISHELLPDGTYVKRKGRRQMTGRYTFAEGRIAYESAEGKFYAGEFAEGRLHQAGMIFYKVN